ncbi:hypothetical protein NDS46_31305 (plasmid) [Paenibacillus thiaminolyticus]|uniref:hypothetical protein n=1 Tax=Paenibacillus thiaminolyticus TaxID=49283 RepID=UPI0023301215|nr:hypothetical protein [Paenibacillus thiaminolyticus]WCF11446.1 hypothetical protein NDS46_31305 [Paenibacillus thiaminolyticus]
MTGAILYMVKSLSSEVFQAYASSAAGVISKRYTPADVDRVKKFFNREKIFSQLNAMVSFLIPDRSNVKLILNVGGGSFTDGQSITVGLPDIFIKSSYEEIFTVLQALIGHEAQHINSSDFDAYKAYQEEIADMFVKKYKHINESLLRGYMKKISIAFGNGVEDGRIEKILGAKFPGYIKYLKFLNGSIWNAQEVKGNSELEDFLYCIVSYSVTGLDPKGFNNVWKGTELEKNYNKLKPMIMKGINATNCRLCLAFCKEMIGMVEPYFVKLLEQRTQEDEEFLNNLPDQPEFTTSSEVDHNTNPSASTHFKPEKKQLDKKKKKKERKKEEGKEGQKRQKSSSKQKEEVNEDESSSKDSENSEEEKQRKPMSSEDKKSENEDTEGFSDGKKSDEEDKTEKDSEDKSDELSGEDGEIDDESTDESDAGCDYETNSNDKNANSELYEGDSDADSGSDNNRRTPDDGDEYDDNLNSSEEIPDEDFVKETMDGLIQELKEDAKDKVSEEPISVAKKVEQKTEDDSRLSEKELAEIKDLYKSDVAKNFYEERGFILRHPLPDQIKIKANRFRREMARIFKNKEMYTLRGQKRGVLDSSNLWKMSVKDTNVFVKKGVPVISDYVGYLLWDGSGSMSSDNKQIHSGYAISIAEEGLKGLLPFKVTQFSVNDCGIVHHVVKDFKENSSMNYGYNFLYHRGADGGNKDGYSIRVATAELMKRPEKDRILIIFSDGLPSYYSGGEKAGMEDVKKAVKEARSKGIFVVSLIFGTESFRGSNIEKYKYMYEKNIISCAPNEITSQLTKMLKKVLAR